LRRNPFIGFAPIELWFITRKFNLLKSVESVSSVKKIFIG
jgi:hypothetical protein